MTMERMDKVMSTPLFIEKLESSTSEGEVVDMLNIVVLVMMTYTVFFLQ